MGLKSAFQWSILVVMLVLLFMLNLSLGSVAIPLKEIFSILIGGKTTDPVWEEIMWDFRMPKAITCVLGGSALALGGLQMQTLFRNPLAGPEVLGLSSGASLGVSLVFMSNAAGVTLFTIQSPWTVAIAASSGSAVVFVVMLAISRKLQDNVSLLIIGMMVGAGTSSIVNVLQFLSNADEMQMYIIWTFGSLGGLNWVEIQILSLILALGIGVAFGNIKSLNAWLLGDNYARSLGIDLRRSRFYTILSSSILAGGVTAFCGPIAFVGLAVPHLVKILIRSHNHKVLIPAVSIGGAALLLGCDILAQLPGNTNILPINAITALIGAPVVIWVIVRNKIVR
jgi:iron complex transport system permease protein